MCNYELAFLLLLIKHFCTLLSTSFHTGILKLWIEIFKLYAYGTQFKNQKLESVGNHLISSYALSASAGQDLSYCSVITYQPFIGGFSLNGFKYSN